MILLGLLFNDRGTSYMWKSVGLLFNDRGTSYMWKSGSSHNQVASGSLDVNFSERKKKYLCLKDSGKIG
jgi:hypothetical protein